MLQRFYPGFLRRRARSRQLRERYPGSEILTHNVGDGARIGSGCYIGPECEVGARTELGDHSYLNKGTLFLSGAIGRFCSIGYYCQIGMHQHPLHHVSTSSRLYGERSILGPGPNVDEFPAPPTLEHDVWVGSNAQILQGTRIGVGAVIAAGAVVAKDVEPYTIVGGVPAKPIRKRFDDESIALLLQWRWWEMSAEELRTWQDVLNADDWQTKLNQRLR